MPGMIRALNSRVDIGGAKCSYLPSFFAVRLMARADVYAIASIFGILVAGGVHVLLSTYFPDHDSLVRPSLRRKSVNADAGTQVEEQVLAIDLVEGRVQGYGDRSAEGSEAGKEKEEVEGPTAVSVV